MKYAAITLLVALTVGAPAGVRAQTNASNSEVFDKVKMLVVRGDDAEEVAVRLRLGPDALVLESRKTGAPLKSFPYSGIKGAEYSYSKHPRWKAGVGAGAGSLVFAPLLLIALPVAIPLAFSKAKRHWLTIRGEHDYVVLKLDKNTRKMLLPAFEVHSGVRVEALGETK